MTDSEILLAATRYEKIRKLNLFTYTKIWKDCLANEIQFDDAIDALPEPFRVKMREESRTCQTCKHWAADTVRIGGFPATSFGKCKENLPFLDSLTTDATFGCNGYQQINNE